MRKLALAYDLVTAMLVASLGVVLVRHGAQGFTTFQVPGPNSSLDGNFAVAALSWLMVGCILHALWLLPDLVRRHVAFACVWVLISFAYLDVVREPFKDAYGDFRPVYNAAVSMRAGQPLPDQTTLPYIYPPLFATVVSPFVQVPLDELVKIYDLTNFLAVVILTLLLYLSLQRYGFTTEVAAVVLLVMFSANVPLMRSLHYHQVNVHVMNLILVSLLTHAGWPIASAVALAIGGHLKVWPLALAIPFLWARRWPWVVAFVISAAAIVALTSYANSPMYYSTFLMEVFRPQRGGLAGLQQTALRNVAIESFVGNSVRMMGLQLNQVLSVIVLKGALVLSFLIAYVRLAGRQVFSRVPGQAAFIETGYVLLPVVMLAVSPSIWEHHFVLLMLTMPILASVLEGRIEWSLFLGAYIAIFLIPVYDIYPISYMRLFALVAIVVLLWRLLGRDVEREGSVFKRLRIGLERITGPG